jgi:NADPH-dependent glutamate synthase beta subunit-like oxidoreductase/Pyruvate/2-oxoacid:ferredoxin oxidoreductase delta subunit
MKQPIIPFAKESSLKNKTGSWRGYLKPEMTDEAPCKKFCPAGENVRDWLNLFKSQDFQEAYFKILESNPFPELMAICPHPCQEYCNLSKRYDYLFSRNEKPVAINRLETLVGRIFLDCRFKMPPLRFSDKIAIIGGGPAGLSAAFYFRWLGYEITIFEKSHALGGMLGECVPKNRLSRKLLRRSLEKIRQIGINVHLNSDIYLKDLENLVERNFVVFLASGARRSKKISCQGNLAPRIVSGLEFLAEINKGFEPLWKEKLKGSKVIIVGGGDTSVDVALEVKRLGAKEVILSAVKITAHQREIKSAKEKGVEILNEACLKSWADDLSGKFKNWAVFSLLPEKFDFERLDEIVQESRNLVHIENVDFIFYAIGEVSDLSWISEPLMKKITVIGNARTGPSLLARALADAREAVLKFHKARHPESKFKPIKFRNKNQLALAGLDFQDLMDPDFYEFSLLIEPNRCLNCGICIDCRQCLEFCPDNSVIAAPKDSFPLYEINYDYCKGCGICVERCRAYGSFCIEMAENVENKEVK